MTLPTRRIADLSVSSVGLGCMPLSFERMLADREGALATIHRAIDLGITVLDTANVYAPAWNQVGHNEALVAEAVRTYTGPADITHLLVTTKGGITRGEGESWMRDSRPGALARAAEDSLNQLGVSVIELYQHHRTDPSIAYADQVEALRGLKEAGLIRRIGLSNIVLAELEVALELIGGPDDGGVVSVQNEYSPRYRRDADVLERCDELGIAFLPWSPLGGADQAHDIGSRYSAFAEVGDELGASAHEAVLAWLLALSPCVIPIPGATKPSTVDSIVRAVSLELSAEQVHRLNATVPADESQYPDDLPRSPLR